MQKHRVAVRGASTRGCAIAERGCVLFDFDGTLANSKPMIVGTATRVLRDFGLPEDELARAGELVGPPFPQAFSMVFGLSERDAEEVTRRYREIYESLGVEAWPVFDGVPELLEGLRAAGKRLGIVSSKRTRLLKRAVADNGIFELFEAIEGKDADHGISKAQTLRDVLQRMGFGSGDAVMVGDRRFDVEAASVCGVPCVGVVLGGTGTVEELEGAGATAVARSVGELGALLLGWGRTSTR